MATAYIATSDFGGVTEVQFFLGFNYEIALRRFHRDLDDFSDFPEKVDQSSEEIEVSDDDRYVILEVEIPDEEIVHEYYNQV
jgi:hypothetical protein